MSQVIENKVVEMQFDNQNFEKNVKQSMDSLNQLNDSLNNVGNDTKAFSGITDALNNLNVTVGKINPLRWKLWEDIYNAAKGVGAKLVGAIMTPIQMASSGGWQRALNIEQAKFQLEGAGQDVEVAFKSASEAVNDTAYSLDEAASIASQLAGSGMQAGDEMTKVLKSISGVAAQTMGSYRDIGDIFVDINSAGKVTGDALNRLAMRGLNAKADLAQALGTTEANIAKMVSKGQISFKQFADAMSKYTDHAFKANETYSGSLANLHSALNKIGADFGQYKIKDMVTLFNSLRLMVNKVRKELTPISEIYGKIHKIGIKLVSDFIDKIDFKWLTPVFDGLANIFMQVIKVGAAVADVIAGIFPKNFGATVQNVAERFRDFTTRLVVSQETLGKVQTIVQGVIAFFKIIGTVIKQVITGLFGFGSAFGGLGETILNVLTFISKGLIWFNDWLNETNALTIAIEKLKTALVVIGAIIVGLTLKVVDFVKSIMSSEIVVKIINYLSEGFTKLKESMKGIGNSVKSISTTGLDAIVGVLQKLRSIIESVVGELTPAKVVIAAAIALLLGLVVTIIVVANKLADAAGKLAGSLNIVGNIRKWIADANKAAEEAKKAAEKKAAFVKFLTVVGLITASVFALKGLASQPIEQIISAVVGVGVIIGLIWAMTKSVSKIPKSAEKNFKILNSVALMLFMLGSALSKAAKHNWKQLAAAGAAMAACILSLVPVIKAVGKLHPNDLQNVAGRSGLIGTLALSFSAIGKALSKAAKYDWDSLLASGAAISGCMLAMGGVVAIISKIDTKKINSDVMLAILALSVGLIPIGVAISKIAEFEWGNILAAARSLVAAIGVLGLVIWGLSNIDAKNITSAIAGAAGILIASLSMIPIAAAIKQLAGYNWDELKGGLAAMAATIGVLTAALAILAAIGVGTEGIGAAAILAAAAAIWICGKALLDIGEAAELASKALLQLTQGFIILTNQVDFKTLINDGMMLIAFLEEFDNVAWTAVKAALALAIGGSGFEAFARGLQSLASVDMTVISDNIVQIFEAIGEGMSKLDGYGLEMEVFSHAFAAFGEVLKGLALASIGLGAGLILAGVGVVAVGAGLNLMDEPLRNMQDLDWSTLVSGIDGVATAFIKFIAITVILGALSAGLMLAAVSLGAIALECYAFNHIDLNMISDGLMSIAGSGAALGAAGLAMLAGAIGVGAMAAAIAGLGVAISMAAVMISKGIDSIITAVAKLKELKNAGVNAVQGFINGITSKLGDVAKSGLELASKFFTAVTGFLGIHSPSTLLKTVGEFTGSGFIIGIADKLDEAEKSGKGLGLSALTGISGLEDLFSAAGAKDAGAYCGSFSSLFNSFFGSGFSVKGGGGMPSNVASTLDKKTGVGGLNGLLDTFNGKLFDTADIEKKVEEASKGAAGGLDSLGDSAGKAGKKTKEAKDELASLYDKIESSISIFDEFKKEDPMDPTQLLNNMKSQIEGMTGWSTQIQQLATKGIDQGLLKKLAEMGPQSYKYTQAFVNMTAEQLAEANKYFEQSLLLPQHVTAQIYGSYEIAGQNAAQGFIGGLSKEDLKTEGVKFAHSFLDNLRVALGIHSPSKETEKDGKNVTQGMINGITWPTSMHNLEVATTIMCNKILDTINEHLKESEFIDIGKNVVAGIEQGIDNGSGSLYEKVRLVCQKVISTAKSPKGFNEHSPSRVFEQIGRYITEGLAIGISDNADMATSAMEELSHTTISNMQNAMNKIQDIVSGDLDVEPVIRPVIDVDDLNYGLDSINSIMSDSLKPNITLNNQNPIDYITQANLMNNNTDVVDAVTSLKDDIMSLKDAMTNIKMVLDTGTMVGAMTPAIDQQLGMRQVLAGRGI